MEAAGVEPASENARKGSPTCLVSAQVLPPKVQRRLFGRPAFFKVHATDEGGPLRYPRFYDAGHPINRAKPDGARRLVRQREVVLRNRQLNFFRLFNEADGNLGMHFPNDYIPVETGTPPFGVYFRDR